MSTSTGGVAGCPVGSGDCSGVGCSICPGISVSVSGFVVGLLSCGVSLFSPGALLLHAVNVSNITSAIIPARLFLRFP
jgi:hypothetical protein